MEDKIKARIGALEKAREAYVAEANAEIRALNTAIGELKGLLTPEPKPPEPGTNSE